MHTQLGRPIATGRTAEIYPWQEGQVLKLFFAWHPLQKIEYEQRIGQAICASGVAAPGVGDLLWVDGRCGLVYRRVDGHSLLQELARRPWRVNACARGMADLHAAIHRFVCPQGIPNQKDRLREKVENAPNLSDPVRRQALLALEKFTAGNSLCHGDFHPDNILLQGQQSIVIDWVDASGGDPLADVARTSILLLGAAHCQVRGVQALFVRIFHAIYLRRYLARQPEAAATYRHWLPIVAAARLSEGINGLEDWLAARAAEGLRQA